ILNKLIKDLPEEVEHSMELLNRLGVTVSTLPETPYQKVEFNLPETERATYRKLLADIKNAAEVAQKAMEETIAGHTEFSESTYDYLKTLYLCGKNNLFEPSIYTAIL